VKILIIHRKHLRCGWIDCKKIFSGRSV